MVKNDPRRFLERYKAPLLLDEVQYAPELFSYIKNIIDREKKKQPEGQKTSVLVFGIVFGKVLILPCSTPRIRIGVCLMIRIYVAFSGAVLEENGKLYPLEIKQKTNPSPDDIKNFAVLSRFTKEAAPGGVLCLAPTHLPLGKKDYTIPISYI